MHAGLVVKATTEEERRERGCHLEELLSEAISISRSLSLELNPPALEERGLGAALQWLVRWMADKHHFHVDLTLATNSEPRSITKRLVLFQCVRELLLNAIKHSGTQEAKVSLWRDPDGYLCVEVTDSGRGFSPDTLESGDSEGLGLASLRQRVSLLGGTLQIKSKPGKGARVQLRLPTPAADDLPEVRPPENNAPIPIPSVAALPAGRPVRVLLADDQQVVRQGLAEALRTQPDFEVVGEAGDGLEAVALAARLQPDVVLLDIAMPGIDGIEATRRIRSHSPAVRVIGLSSYDEAEKGSAMREAGATDYVSKHQPLTHLLTIIRRSVGGNSGLLP
jgi:CheY-like chemotaxis protein